jgi:hypothetical protein
MHSIHAHFLALFCFFISSAELVLACDPAAAVLNYVSSFGREEGWLMVLTTDSLVKLKK